MQGGLYEYLRMPFGLRNAPSTFQRELQLSLQVYHWLTCLIYIDVVIIYSPTAENHLDDVEQVLEVLLQEIDSLNLSKCFFFISVVHYLEHVIKAGKMEIHHVLVAETNQVKAPSTLTD